MGEFFDMQEDGILDSFGEYIGYDPKEFDSNFSCKHCFREFNTERGLIDHNKAKHRGK